MNISEIKQAIRKARRKLTKLRGGRDADRKRLAERRGERRDRRKKRKALDRKLRRAKDDFHADPTRENAQRVDALQARREKLSTAIDDLNRRIRKLRHEIDQARARIRWWVAKRTWLRRKLRRKRESGDASWEPWMANGRDARVTQSVKDFIARGVVNFDLYCTSLRRSYVPPGGSYTSFHLVGKAGDCAGSKMAAHQADEFERGKGDGDCLELFGPTNDKWIKNGQPTGGAEGTPNEQLHDTHNHGAFN